MWKILRAFSHCSLLKKKIVGHDDAVFMVDEPALALYSKPAWRHASNESSGNLFLRLVMLSHWLAASHFDLNLDFKPLQLASIGKQFY